MQLEQRFALAAAPARVWAAFRDVPLLVECLPGAALTGGEADGAWPLRFDAKLGPIGASFVGKGRAAFDDAARAGRFEGSATDARTQSRVKGAASFRVEAEGESSVVVVGVDYTLTGSLAQFGRGGIVRELANALTTQFAARLAARLPQTSVEVQGPAATISALTAAITAPATADLVAGGQQALTVEASGAATAPNGAVRAGVSMRASPAAPAMPTVALLPNAPLDAGSLLALVLRARWHRFIAWLLRRAPT